MLVVILAVVAIALVGLFIGSQLISADFKGLGLDVFGGILATLGSFITIYQIHVKIRPRFSIEGKSEISDWIWIAISLVAAVAVGYVLHKLLF
jgi:hypothetical protein